MKAYPLLILTCPQLKIISLVKLDFKDCRVQNDHREVSMK